MFLLYKKYTNDEIQSLIYPYILLEYISTTNIIAKDDDGYKYKLTLSNLLDNKVPSKWMRNLFATDNIKHYLEVNYPNYIWLGNEYHGIKTKEQFICNSHKEYGIQMNTFDNIINNHHACKYCGYENLRDKKVLQEDKIIELCNERNVIYHSRYTKNHESYIVYSCEKHSDMGLQEMSLTHFKESNIPCRYCNITSGELKIQNYLIQNNIKFETQKTFLDCINVRPLKFDFYLPLNKMCIEYDGQQHYHPVNFSNSDDGGESNFILAKKRDEIKNNYCKENNIKLLRIPYWDYDNIEKILSVKI